MWPHLAGICAVGFGLSVSAGNVGPIWPASLCPQNSRSWEPLSTWDALGREKGGQLSPALGHQSGSTRSTWSERLRSVWLRQSQPFELRDHSAGASRKLATPTNLYRKRNSATVKALAICGGDAIAALRITLIANAFLEAEVDRLSAAVSSGFARGKVRKALTSKKAKENKTL